MAEAFKTLEDGSVVKVTETPVSTEELTSIQAQLQANVDNLKPQVEAAVESSNSLQAQLQEAEAALVDFNANVTFPAPQTDPGSTEGVSESVDTAGDPTVDQVTEPTVTF